MTGKVLVYGGSGGIGRAVAEALVTRGYGLHLVARDGARLSDAARALGASYTIADATSVDDVKRATEEAAADGPLAGLVYAVGTINLKPLARLSAADFETDFRVNALGAALAVQAAVPKMQLSAGIVLFSTVAAAQGFTAHASVAMAKGAVEGLTLALAAELAPKIRVNCIAPSLTDTPLAKGFTGNEAMVSAIAGMHALQRLGKPQDIAPLAALLVSGEAGWITGQIIGVDGGRSSLRTKG